MTKTHLDRAMPRVKRLLKAVTQEAAKIIYEAAVQDAVEDALRSYDRCPPAQSPPSKETPSSLLAEARAKAQAEDVLAEEMKIDPEDEWKGEHLIRKIERDGRQAAGRNMKN